MANTMKKAFATVSGAIKRNDVVELKCKKIWLQNVIKLLPGTIYEVEANRGLEIVERLIAADKDGNFA
jgi:hypothetical protein